jgi:hypothetical protein
MNFTELNYPEEDSSKLREILLEECIELGLPVKINDDLEILKLIYEAAKDKARDQVK